MSRDVPPEPPRPNPQPAPNPPSGVNDPVPPAAAFTVLPSPLLPSMLHRAAAPGPLPLRRHPPRRDVVVDWCGAQRHMALQARGRNAGGVRVGTSQCGRLGGWQGALAGRGEGAADGEALAYMAGAAASKEAVHRLSSKRAHHHRGWVSNDGQLDAAQAQSADAVAGDPRIRHKRPPDGLHLRQKRRNSRGQLAEGGKGQALQREAVHLAQHAFVGRWWPVAGRRGLGGVVLGGGTV